jgi:hypothetical protein
MRKSALNQWYVVMDSDQVKARPVGVTRMGEKLVFPGLVKDLGLTWEIAAQSGAVKGVIGRIRSVVGDQ